MLTHSEVPGTTFGGQSRIEERITQSKRNCYEERSGSTVTKEMPKKELH